MGFDMLEPNKLERENQLSRYGSQNVKGDLLEKENQLRDVMFERKETLLLD